MCRHRWLRRRTRACGLAAAGRGGGAGSPAGGEQLDAREEVAHLALRVAAILRVAEAELAGVVVPPALRRAVAERGAADGRKGECGELHRHGREGVAEVDGGEGVAHLALLVATVLGVAEAEL